tara:strand:- start:1895 stop:2764 length:870 start_codon:yes stop_codon:yes gene_type:complete
MPNSSQNISVVIDSSCCLPEPILNYYQINTVYHSLIINDKSYKDILEIKPDTLFKLLRKNNITVKTSAPNPSDFLNVFSSIAKKNKNILCLTISKQFSSAFNNAIQASKQLKVHFPNTSISIVDTETAAGGEGLLALELAEKIKLGWNLNKLTKFSKQLSKKIELFAFIDSLKYLQQSGRISSIKGWAGQILGLKPVFVLKNDQYQLLYKTRTRAKAKRKLIELIEAKLKSSKTKILLMHADALQDINEIKEAINNIQTSSSPPILNEFTSVMGAHTGPGTIAIALLKN